MYLQYVQAPDGLAAVAQHPIIPGLDKELRRWTAGGPKQNLGLPAFAHGKLERGEREYLRHPNLSSFRPEKELLRL